MPIISEIGFELSSKEELICEIGFSIEDAMALPDNTSAYGLAATIVENLDEFIRSIWDTAYFTAYSKATSEALERFEEALVSPDHTTADRSDTAEICEAEFLKVWAAA